MPNRPTSPIERMIDKACRRDPNATPKPDFKAIGNVMLEVCDAAKVWKHNHAKGRARLAAAVKRYVELGG